MAYSNDRRNAQRQVRGGNHKSFNRPTLMDVLRQKDSSTLNLAMMVRNSASLRRHVSLAIKQQMLASGNITAEDKFYARFGLTHFTVKVNGLGQDYHYTEVMFLRALMSASITIVACIEALINDFTSEKFNEPLVECDFLSNESSLEEVKAIAGKVMEHINDQIDVEVD